MSHSDSFSSDPQRVQTRRIEAPTPGLTGGTTLDQDLAIAARLAKLFDARFSVAGVKFGLDALVGLVPVAGDVINFCVGLYPIYLARKHKLGNWLTLRMIGNLGIDAAVGAVPLVGDAADIFFRAQLKNLRLFEEAARKRQVFAAST